MNSKVSPALILMAPLVLLLSACLPDPPSGPSLWEVVEARTDLNLFIEGMELMSYDEDVKANFAFTLLAPNDSAMLAWLSARGYATLQDVPRQELGFMLRYHMQFGGLNVLDVADGYFRTLCPRSPDSMAVVMQISEVGGKFSLNEQSNLLVGGEETRTGYLNVIDSVVTIPSLFDLIRLNPQFSLFEEGMVRVGLSSLFRGSAPHTVLVPTNSALETFFDRNQVESFDQMTDSEVRAIIRAHVIPNNHTYEEIALAFSTLYDNIDNGKIRMSSASAGTLSINDTIGVPLYDVQATNGVIHALSKVIDPR